MKKLMHRKNERKLQVAPLNPPLTHSRTHILTYLRTRLAQLKTEAAQKKEAEKEKIKKQYEAYMKLKSNTNTVVDKQREKEFEELNSDIKDLLSTIQNKPKEATTKKK